MRPITLQRLDVFRAVYERGSINAAAKDLKLTQPTVSKHLRDFESAIGITLFELKKGRLHPTVDADALFLECRHIKDGLNRLEGQIESLRGGRLRTLEVQAIAPLIYEHLPRAVRAATDHISGLQLSINVANGEDQLRALRAGRIDLGLLAGPLPPHDLRAEPIGKGTLLLLLPPDHPLAKRPAVTRQEVKAACGLIRLSTLGTIGGLVSDEIGYTDPDGGARMTIRSLQLASGLCEQLNAPIVIDCLTAVVARQSGMITRPITPAITFDLYAMTNPLTKRNLASETLIRALRASLADRVAALPPVSGTSD